MGVLGPEARRKHAKQGLAEVGKGNRRGPIGDVSKDCPRKPEFLAKGQGHIGLRSIRANTMEGGHEMQFQKGNKKLKKSLKLSKERARRKMRGELARR